jgi:hypothetical protein
MAARCYNDQLWRGHRSRRFRPCLVRMAVGVPRSRLLPETVFAGGGFLLAGLRLRGSNAGLGVSKGRATWRAGQ